MKISRSSSPQRHRTIRPLQDVMKAANILLDALNASCSVAALNISIVPDRIHAKSGLLNIKMRHSPQELIVPSVHLYPPLLIIAKRQPLITPRTRTHSIRVTTTCWCWIQTYLPLDLPIPTKLERCDVTGQFRAVRSRCGEQIFPAMRAQDHIGTVHLGTELCEVWWYQRVVCPGVDGHVCYLVDDIDADTVPGFHEDVEIGI